MSSYLSIPQKQWASAPLFLRNGELLGHSPIQKGRDWIQACNFYPGFPPPPPHNSGSHNVTEKLLRATMHQIPLYLNNGNYSYD
jgi:hypothetical protein